MKSQTLPSKALLDQVIDLNAIRYLEDAIGDALPLLVDTYLTSVPEILEIVAGCITTRDYATVAREGHSLRSNCDQIGARKMQYLCADLEKAAKAGDDPRLHEILPQIRGAWKEVYLQLKELKLA